MEDLKALAIFAETVQQKSFRGAAGKLGLSPSVVSYHVSQLEKQVGTPLLYRSTRKISLTHKGKILYRHAAEMLASARKGLDEISAHGAEPRGSLTVALPSALTRAPVTSHMAVFCRNHPGIQVKFIYTDVRPDPIEKGIDLAIRAGKMPDSALMSRRIGTVHRRLVASPEYAGRHPVPTHPQDLSEWQWIKLSMLPNERTLRREDETVTVHYENQVSVDNVEAMTQFCRHGLGLSSPPDFLTDDLIRSGKLIKVLPEWKVEPIPMTAVWPPNSIREANTQRLLDHLDHLPQG
ncbi:MAG: LysR family transcriptional regulator [Desulfobacterales bacterium]|nr:LysR family transcriptional regulator [Desulfobacterales bacterium]